MAVVEMGALPGDAVPGATPDPRRAPKSVETPSHPHVKVLRETFFEQARDLVDADQVDVSRLKQTVCIGRASIEASKNDQDAEVIEDEIEVLRKRWNQEFFGYGSRKLSASTWWKAAQAYEMLALAESCLRLVEPAIEAKNEELVQAIGAAIVCPHALFIDSIHGVIDVQQKDTYERFRNLVGDALYVRALDGVHPFEDLLAEASTLDEQVARFRKSKDGQAALETLKALLTDSAAHENFEELLEAALERALDAGIAPSNKVLRDVACNYISIVVRLKDKSKLGRKLCEYAQEKLAKDLAKHEEYVGNLEEIEEDDPEVVELRRLLKGKTMLFVGGNKGQHERKKAITDLFRLKELIWPDAEEATHIDRLKSKVAKADVVVQLIRFSRHSYKEALDEGKRQGKAVARLTHGLGLKTMTHQLHQQLVCRVAASAA